MARRGPTSSATWSAAKRQHPKVSDERFELLVRNDVNAYLSVVQRRRESKVRGPNYGHKIWLLTLDSMPWRIPGLIGRTADDAWQVAMGTHYLINLVAVVAGIGSGATSDDALPATLFLDEREQVPSELREVVTREWNMEGKKTYQKERRIRELVHEAKASRASDEAPAGAADPAGTPEDERI